MVLSAVAVSCAYRSDIPDYAHPEILDASAEVGDTDIILTTKVSDSEGIKECGFYFGEDKDNMTMYQSELPSDDTFSLTLRNIPRGKTYYFQSFISGGEDTRMSGTQAIDFAYKAPLLSIESLTTYGRSEIEYEFSVKDDHSGDLVCCGICFNTSGTPDIRSEFSTMDGGSYGTYKSFIETVYEYEIGKTYYFRAYAITSNGVYYSDEVKFTFSISFLSDSLEKYMYDTWDENSDGALSYEESDKVTKIDITSDNVSSLKGVEAFWNLDTLICRGISCGQDGGSGSLSEINLNYLNWRYNPNISYMDLSNNRLSSTIYISMMKWLDKLKYLNLSGNSLEMFSTSLWLGPSLTELDLSNNYFLGSFQSQCENLESLNLRGCSKLVDIYLSPSSVKSLDLSDFTELEWLDVNDSQKLTELKGLNLCEKLIVLHCENCAMETLDVSGLDSLKKLECDSPTLKKLYLTKNQKNNLSLMVGENTEIICVD